MAASPYASLPRRGMRHYNVCLAKILPRERIFMPLDWAPLVDVVRRQQRFLLTTHIRPDGDGIGSMQALGRVLQQQGKEVQCVIASSMPPRYRFLDPDGRIEEFAPPGDRWRNPGAVIVLDTGTWN